LFVFFANRSPFTSFNNALSEASTHNHAHTKPSTFVFQRMPGKKARARKQKRERRRDANAGEAIPRLPNHLVATHVLRSEYFDDPADLARLPALSRAMRDAVAATGLQFEELAEVDALKLGCLSALQRLQRQGRLSRQEYLCAAAARSGQLEELRVLRANGCPWNANTCSGAALGGYLEVLRWLRANGCLWDEDTCKYAAWGGHLQVLQWARVNGCPWDEKTLLMARGRSSRVGKLGDSERLP
jgi:hypothetical protein